jgi:chaperone modulatory protein CbpM
MQTALLKITEFCSFYNIQPNFIISLEDSGVIELTVVDNDKFIHEDQFNELERYVHLHYDLNINVEGIDALKHLLNKVNALQDEVNQLQNQLHFHQGKPHQEGS